MPITAAHISAASAAVTTNASSYTTGAFTPVADRLYLLAVRNPSADKPTSITTTTGLTFVEIQTETRGTVLTVTLYRAMKASGLSNGTITINYGAGQTGCIHSVDEFDGVDTSGTDGSGAIVQVGAGTNGSGTTADDALAAFGDATNNAGFLATYINSNVAITHEAGWTELFDAGHGAPTRAGHSEWRLGEDTTPTSTFSTSQWTAISAEIKAAAAPPAGGPVGRRALLGVGI